MCVIFLCRLQEILCRKFLSRKKGIRLLNVNVNYDVPLIMIFDRLKSVKRYDV